MKNQAISRTCFWILVVLFLQVPVFALAQASNDREEWLANYRHFGAAATLTFPSQDFGDDFNTGFGIHLLLDYPLIAFLNLTADGGWNHFPGADGYEAVDIFNLAAGGKIALGAFFMGGEAGYFSEIDEWSWIPSIGVRPGNWEVALRFKAAGTGTWTTVRAGYYF